MKKALVLFTLLICMTSYGQRNESTEEGAIKGVLMQFFESINTKDSLLYKNSLFLEGQVYSINHSREPVSHRVRKFSNVKMFETDKVYTEIPYAIEIQWHKGLAMAWVPYEFLIDDAFSHCGIDVFTLIKAGGDWKISHLAYTVEKSDCEALKKAYQD